MLHIGGLISAAAFVIIVGIVLYKVMSTALFYSKTASAGTQPIIEDEQLQEAIDLIQKWNSDFKEEQPE